MHLHYQMTEPVSDSQEIVVLLGGLTRDHTIWRKVVPKLQASCRVMTLDNPDSGQSKDSRSPHGIAEYAEDIIELLDYLGQGPVHIVGQSMGGFMAMHIAAKRPDLVKSLVLCSTVEKQVSASVEYLQARIDAIDAAGSVTEATTASEADIRAVMPKIYWSGSLTPEFVDDIVTFEVSNKFPQSAERFKRQAVACLQHDATDLVSKITAPTLVVTAEHDAYYGPEVAYALAEKISGARVVIVPKAAHMIQVEQPEALAKEIKKIVAENATPTRRPKL